MAMSCRRLPKRQSTEPTENRAFLRNSVPAAADAIGRGSRAATRNRLPSRTQRATPRQGARRGEMSLVPAVECGSRRNQERPGAAAMAADARRDRAKFRSRKTARAKERARLMFGPMEGRRSVTPPAETRRKRAVARGIAAARRAARKGVGLGGGGGL